MQPPHGGPGAPGGDQPPPGQAPPHGYGPPPGYGGPPGYGPHGYGPHGSGPHGYGPPPGYGGPPRPKGPSLGIVVLICLAAAVFVVPIVIGAVVGFRNKVNQSKAKVVDPASVKLSESYATTNGALVAHYPSDFVAKRLDEATVVLSRRLPVGDETVTLGVLPYDKAATDDIEEFARLMLVAVEKNVEGKGGTSTRGKGRDAMCLGKYEGIEFEPTFSLPDAGDYVGKACFFEHNERAHIVRYDVVASQAEREIPLLERIINATELRD